MDTVRVAVIGTGVMGAQHVDAYVRHPAAEVVAVVDVREAIAAEAAGPSGAKAFTDTAQMLQACEIDAASICTSDECHVEPTLACLAAGKHVLLEKPIATTVADAERIIQAAEGSAGKLLVGHIVRFNPKYAHVKRSVEAGQLGEVEAIFARRLNSVASQEVLRGRVSVLSFLGVHDFDYIRWVADSEPVRIYTESVAKVHAADGYDVEDHTFTLVRFASGAAGCVEVGWILPKTHPLGADFKLEVIGTRGVAHVDLASQDLVVCGDAGWQAPSVDHGLDHEIAHFIDCLGGDAQPLITGADGLAALRMSLAAQESARTGKVIHM